MTDDSDLRRLSSLATALGAATTAGLEEKSAELLGIFALMVPVLPPTTWAGVVPGMVVALGGWDFLSSYFH